MSERVQPPNNVVPLRRHVDRDAVEVVMTMLHQQGFGGSYSEALEIVEALECSGHLRRYVNAS